MISAANLRDEILKEHSRKQALSLAAFACESKSNFKALMQFFLDKEYRVAQRAAYAVSWAALQCPQMIDPYIGILIEQLERKDVHEAIPRNALRILESIAVPEKYHGELMDICFRFVQDPQTAIAIRAASLMILFNLSSSYPEIKPEIKLIIEENWEHGTAAFRSRGRKILMAFEKKA